FDTEGRRIQRVVGRPQRRGVRQRGVIRTRAARPPGLLPPQRQARSIGFVLADAAVLLRRFLRQGVDEVRRLRTATGHLRGVAFVELVPVLRDRSLVLHG